MPNGLDSRPPPPPLHYAKHTNSMREVKSTKTTSNGGFLMDTGDSIRSKLMNNGSLSRATVDNSMNFVRPLKTSTAVCLNEVRGRPNTRSVEDQPPDPKPKRDESKETPNQAPPKRRHSVQTTTKTTKTTQITLKKTKIKATKETRTSGSYSSGDEDPFEPKFNFEKRYFYAKEKEDVDGAEDFSNVKFCCLTVEASNGLC